MVVHAIVCAKVRQLSLRSEALSAAMETSLNLMRLAMTRTLPMVMVAHRRVCAKVDMLIRSVALRFAVIAKQNPIARLWLAKIVTVKKAVLMIAFGLAHLRPTPLRHS